MPTLNVLKDGYCLNVTQGSTWAATRDAATSSNVNTSSTRLTVDCVHISGRGPTLFAVSRTFLYFNTTGISAEVSSATLKLYGGTNQNNTDFIAVKGTQSGDPATSDFDSMTGWSTGSADGSGAGDNESNVTKYSAEIDQGDVSTSGYFDVPLNAQAMADMENNGTLGVVLINFDYDLKDIDPGAGNINSLVLWSADYSSGSRIPYIDYTLAGAAAVTHNAPFFGTNF